MLIKAAMLGEPVQAFFGHSAFVLPLFMGAAGVGYPIDGISRIAAMAGHAVIVALVPETDPDLAVLASMALVEGSSDEACVFEFSSGCQGADLQVFFGGLAKFDEEFHLIL